MQMCSSSISVGNVSRRTICGNGLLDTPTKSALEDQHKFNKTIFATSLMKNQPIIKAFFICIIIVLSVVSGGMFIKEGLIFPIRRKLMKNESNNTNNIINKKVHKTISNGFSIIV